jgi:hypothetical protein
VSRLESGLGTYPRYAARLADTLGLTIDELTKVAE